MQKKIIALAIAAAFSAPAFADVTAYGIVDAAVVHASADGQKSDTQVLSGGLASSRIGFKGAEDLNNGMKAVVVLEYGLDTQTSNNAPVAGATGSATNIAARQQMLAIAGDFGTFATGYLQTTGYDWASKFDPTAGSAVSPLQSVTKGGVFLIGSNTIASRAQRALAYISPEMAGVTVAVNYSTDTGLGGTADKLFGTAAYGNATGLGNLAQASINPDMKVPAYMVSAMYTGVQNLAVGAVIANAKLSQFDANIKDMALGGSYDLSVVKLFLTYQTTKIDASGSGNGSSKAMSFSAVAPVGPGAIAFTYAKNTMDANTWGTDADGKGMTVAWLQGLSKTTTFYAALEKVSQGANTNVYSGLNNALGGGAAAQGAAVAGNPALNLGGSSTILAVGLNKKF